MYGLSELIDQAYEDFGASEAGLTASVPPALLGRLMNEEWQDILIGLKGVAPNLFMRSVTATLTKNTAYTLPADCEQILDIRDTSDNSILAVDYSDRTLQTTESRFERTGFNQITPRFGTVASAVIRYRRSFGSLNGGTLSDGAADSATLPASPTYGNLTLGDDYYNGMLIYFHNGTGAGQWRRIADFVASTRVVTPESDFDTPPTAGTYYSVLPPFPEEYHMVLKLGAMLRQPIPGLRQKVSIDLYGRLRSSIERWAQDFWNETRSPSRVLDEETDAGTI